MKWPTDRDDRRDLAIGILGGVVIFANGFAQEVLGWGFVPLGAIGAALLGLGYGRWYDRRRKRSGGR